MANVESGNTIFIDTTGVAAARRTKVTHMVVSPSDTDCRLVLVNTNNDSTTKMDLRIADGRTLFFDFSGNPMYFPDGVKATTATSVAVTIVRQAEGA